MVVDPLQRGVGEDEVDVLVEPGGDVALRERESRHVRDDRPAARASMAGDESMPTVSAACMLLVQDGGQVARAAPEVDHAAARATGSTQRQQVVEGLLALRSGTARTGRGSTRRSESPSPLPCLVRPQALAVRRRARRAASPRLTWVNGSRAAPVRAPGRPRPPPPPAPRSVPGGLRHCRVRPRRRTPSLRAPVSRAPRNVVQARPRRTTRVSCAGPAAPSRGAGPRAVIFSAIGRLARAGARGRAVPPRPPARASTRSGSADVDEPGAQRVERHLVVERDATAPRRPARCRAPPRPSSGTPRSRCRRPGWPARPGRRRASAAGARSAG